MRKLALTLTVALALMLAGCGGATISHHSNSPTSTSITQAADRAALITPSLQQDVCDSVAGGQSASGEAAFASGYVNMSGEPTAAQVWAALASRC